VPISIDFSQKRPFLSSKNIQLIRFQKCLKGHTQNETIFHHKNIEKLFNAKVVMNICEQFFFHFYFIFIYAANINDSIIDVFPLQTIIQSRTLEIFKNRKNFLFVGKWKRKGSSNRSSQQHQNASKFDLRLI
jgi:hypothetical protein